MTFWQVLGGAFLAGVLSVILRESHAKIAGLLPIAAAILLFGYSLSETATILRSLDGYAAAYELSSPLSYLLKALGISAAADLFGGILRDSGEASLADRLDTAARLSILSLALPLFTEILETAVRYAS